MNFDNNRRIEEQLAIHLHNFPSVWNRNCYEHKVVPLRNKALKDLAKLCGTTGVYLNIYIQSIYFYELFKKNYGSESS